LEHYRLGLNALNPLAKLSGYYSGSSRYVIPSIATAPRALFRE